MERKNHMRKNSKNEKVIRAMAIGISAMLMASSPLTALAAEGEGTTPEGNDEDLKILLKVHSLFFPPTSFSFWPVEFYAWT